MGKIKFLFALHNHQPVGNFGHVFEQAYEQAYLPLLERLEAHPPIKTSLHYSGPLLEWLEDKRPEFLDRLAALSKAGQVELVGGSFYESMLTIIPRQDALGQLRLMGDYLKRRLKASPAGCWLAERVWDSSLPPLLTEGGYRYTVLDDTHFRYAGLRDEQIVDHYHTERAGEGLSVFPIDKVFRYTIPFKEPEETLNRLRELMGHGVKSATYADDGEKFGLWPGTHDWVFNQGWLERFFKALEQNSDWLETATFSQRWSRRRRAVWCTCHRSPTMKC